MRRHIVAGVLIGVGLLLLGCNPKIGIISFNTNPQGAALYLNGAKIGETPAKFQFDMEKPVTLKLLKEGYEPQEEKLTVGWVKSEYYRGNYHKGDYLINGRMQKGFEVHATRDLVKTEGPVAPPTDLGLGVPLGYPDQQTLGRAGAQPGQGAMVLPFSKNPSLPPINLDPGDVILAIDGVVVEGPGHVTTLLAHKGPGAMVQVRTFRCQYERQIEQAMVVLQGRP